MATEAATRVSTGIPGLDEILHGGLVPGRAYLLRGGPGTGKTVIGLHFLTAGVAAGERALFISLGEPEQRLEENAASLGMDLTGITFYDISPTAEYFTQSQSYDIFSPAEVEREPITQQIIALMESERPQRVFIDALTQFRYLSTDPLEFRRQMLALLRFLTDHGATVLFTSEASDTAPDDDLMFMSDGIIHLSLGDDGRGVSVSKFRGSDFQSGRHSLRITGSGVVVSPRLVPAAHGARFVADTIPSGVPHLDALLNGGLERGTVTIISGPNGVGKTTVGLQFMKEAARRGERSIVYAFEESPETLTRRSTGIGIAVGDMIERGTLAIVPVEPLLHTPDEFALMVRREVEQNGAQIIMIDSISGYRLAIRGQDLVSHLHALSQYLRNMGVTVILVNEVEYITGDFRVTDVGISYLADNVIFLRYLEVKGEMRKAIGVLKKRLSDFERTLRGFEITGRGIKIGEPLTNLRGILLGTPEWVGRDEDGRDD